MKEILNHNFHVCILGYLGYVPGVCSSFLRFFFIWKDAFSGYWDATLEEACLTGTPSDRGSVHLNRGICFFSEYQSANG